MPAVLRIDGGRMRRSGFARPAEKKSIPPSSLKFGLRFVARFHSQV